MDLLKTVFIEIFILLTTFTALSNALTDTLENKLDKIDDHERIVLYHDLIWEYFKTNPSKSIFYGKEAIKLSSKLGDSAMLAYSYRYTGIGYKMTGMYDEALDYYFKSLDLLQSIGNAKSIAKAQISIGNIYGELGRYDDAKKYLKNALATARMEHDSGMMTRTSMALGIIFHRNMEFDSAFKYYDKSEQIAVILQNEKDLSILFSNIGLYYSNLKDHNKALSYYNKSLKLKEGIQDKYGKANVMTNIGADYVSLGKYSKALNYLEESMKISNEIDAIDLKKNNYLNLSELYEKKGDYKKALKNHHLFTELKDSIFNEKSESHIAQLIALNKLNEHLAENKNLIDDNRIQILKINQQRTIGLFLIITVIGATITIVILLKLYHTKKKNLDFIHKVINSLTHPFYVINPKDNSIELSNKAARQETIPMSMRCKTVKREIDKPCAGKNCKCSIEQITKTKKAFHAENIKILIDKKERYFEIHSFPVFNKKGELEKIIEYNRDITKRKLAEIAVKQSERKLRSVNEAKDKLFSILAHDIKNPFTFLIGISDLLIEDPSVFSEEEKHEIYQKINDTSTQTHKLFETLMEWARAQTGRLKCEPERINMKELIVEIEETLQVFAKNKNIRLSTICEKEIFAHADKNMVKTILRNLGMNAVKFTAKEGKIDLGVQYANKHVEVYVSDTGIGMPKELTEKLFSLGGNISRNGTANETGLGIGLVLSKELVEKSKGKIWVESEAGKGSRFTFTLPRK
ncbi:MAG: tetratricopeptide repeat protein [Chlorobi bacterium]|nr:tetratricopeptide repeat protein [Chlorobiota bacterium]